VRNWHAIHCRNFNNIIESAVFLWRDLSHEGYVPEPRHKSRSDIHSVRSLQPIPALSVARSGKTIGYILHGDFCVSCTPITTLITVHTNESSKEISLSAPRIAESRMKLRCEIALYPRRDKTRASFFSSSCLPRSLVSSPFPQPAGRYVEKAAISSSISILEPARRLVNHISA